MKRWGSRLNNIATKGFTIIELIIVIVVIAILATVVVVGYEAVVNNANDSAVKSDLTKLADKIKLKTLDDGSAPDGGATSSNTGDSTLLSGITFDPASDAYDTTVANLYYCSGEINGIKEYAVIAQSQSGNAFVLRSYAPVKNLTEYTLTSTNNGVALCGAIGFTAPFTWSYGYNPTVGYGWFLWAYNGVEWTNLVSNPSFEANVTGWTAYMGVAAPTRVSTTPAVGSWRLSAVGNNTATTPRVYHDISAVAGTVLSASVRVRSDGQIPTNLLMVIKTLNSGTETSTLSVSPAWAPDASGWMTGNFSVTVPAGSNGIRLNPGVTVAANYTGTLGIDAAIVIEGSTTPAYADGSSLRWRWNGTTHNSTSTGPAL